MPNCRIKSQPFSHKKSAKLQIGSICTQKCCRIRNCQTSKCCRFVIRQITETETGAVRSHEGVSDAFDRSLNCFKGCCGVCTFARW